ncbi:hypothetical protein LXH13_04610 [Streptomyces spinosirectus]|jgi:hypothetical protein|uniref:hypothetical protein n=1 Tax=Streptomyces spinosirectus TaxID=2906474 RepID=UPI001F38B64F|nr:hypothetical protein [Streptomyces spinosirectus]UIR16349.1 hypothetical protein LXH13_04610 [Streptomyces spinosirectus]
MNTAPSASCTATPDGSITFDLPLPPAQGHQLLLRLRPGKGQPERTLHTLDLEPTDNGRVRAVLGPAPLLEEGRWDVFLLRGGDAPRQRLRPGLRDLRALVDGHLRDREPPLAVRIPYVTTNGCLAIRAWLRPAHAEADGVDVTERTTTVGARLHGTSLRTGAVVRLRLRGGGGVVHTVQPRAGDDGRAFSFTLDHAELVAATGAASGVWDVFVQPAADAPLVRVARLLDDVADRKNVFVYPRIGVDGAVLRPYYTVDNDLSVEVKRPG